jgi:glycosyltransferase involved in cell wall biosynthesis
MQRLDSLAFPLGTAALGIPFTQRPFGVNLIGHAYNVFGIGEDARAITAALRAAAIPCCVIDHPADNGSATTDRSLHELVLPPGEEGPYAFNLVCMAAPIHARWVCQEGLSQQRGRYTIVSWPWETERWPQAWEAPLALADEAWPFSSLIETALRPFASPAAGRSQMQITRMPPPAEIHDPARYGNPLSRRSARENFGLPQDRVLFVFGFDLNSTLTRKNPMAVVEAFQRAFPEIDPLGDRVALVIKILPSSSAHPAWEQLRRGIEQDQRLHVIEASLDRTDLLALYGCCDIFVSLHRSEGLGRGHAEALQLGLDVIVTNYGSTTDFCTGPRAHPVRYRLVPIAEGEYFEHEGQVWADPDVDHAAEVMREVALCRLTHPHEIDHGLTAGFRQRFSSSAVGVHYRKRLEELWKQKDTLAAGLKANQVMMGSDEAGFRSLG